MMPRVLICVPVYPCLDDRVSNGVEEQLNSKNCIADVLYLTGNIVPASNDDWGRNLAHKQQTAQVIALRFKYDYLFLVEADVVLPPNALDMLVDGIPNNKSVISGWYRLHDRSGPLADMPTIFERKDGKLIQKKDMTSAPGCQTGVVEVDFSILGCTLIPQMVLYTNNLFDSGVDATFTNRCLELGYHLYVDFTVYCEHLKLR